MNTNKPMFGLVILEIACAISPSNTSSSHYNLQLRVKNIKVIQYNGSNSCVMSTVVLKYNCLL